jgi:pimeloyl-ACP methyl ester carboxylesterase
MNLLPWSSATSANLTLRGWHSVPSGKPLLNFLHGNGFSARTYEPMLQSLAPHFDLWLTEVQGHGDSDPGGAFLGWRGNAMLAGEALMKSKELFGEVPRFGLGHSYGGIMTSYLLANQPTLFQRAVLLDPVLFTPVMLGVMALGSLVGIASNDFASRALKRRQHWPDREAAYFDFYQRGIFKGWTEEALRAHLAHSLKEVVDGVELKCHPTQEAAVFGSYPQGLWSSLKKVATPTHVLHGERSYPFVGKSVTRLVKKNRWVSAQQVSGGHCFMQEFPEDTAQRISQFLLA